MGANAPTAPPPPLFWHLCAKQLASYSLAVKSVRLFRSSVVSDYMQPKNLIYQLRQLIVYQQKLFT